MIDALLSLELDGHRVLERVALRVDAGESIALVGPNGSGKTSVLRCLLGLVPFSGTATIAGHDVVRAPVAARAALAYVPQKPAFGDASAGEVLAFVARLRGVARARVAEALRAVALDRHATQRVRTFSGGMQQRLSLATALVADPPVLLLAEPTANLDAAGQDLFFALVDGWRRRGRTLVLASHRPEEVHALTDRVVPLENGRVVVAARRPTPLREVAGGRA